MVELTRRRFLARSAGAGAVAVLAGSAGITWEELRRHAATNPLVPGSRVLVVVSMYGGNDGINTVIPYADNAYHDARPELSYRPEEVLHLDDGLGLNPAMKGMAKLWQQQRLAIVRGVGYPKPDHSHFRSMDIWQTASPGEPVSTGWIGRWLDATGDDPVRAVNIGSVLPPLAVGTKATAAALSLGKQTGLPADLAAAVTDISGADSADSTCAAQVRGSYRARHTVTDTFAAARSQASTSPADAKSLTAQLDLVGRCIKAGVPTKVYTVSLGGFDTHADERDTQQRLLATLDSAVAKFLDDMADDPRGRGVVLLAYSEFGRRVEANASQGTDHGTAGPVFLGGIPVRAGFHGDEPSLADLDNGDLKSTTDFRDIYHELLHGVLGADPEVVLGKGRRDLGLLA